MIRSAVTCARSAGPPASLLIREQRKRRHLIGSVAILTVLLKDPHDVFMVSGRRLLGTRPTRSPTPRAATPQSNPNFHIELRAKTLLLFVGHRPRAIARARLSHADPHHPWCQVSMSQVRDQIGHLLKTDRLFEPLRHERACGRSKVVDFGPENRFFNSLGAAEFQGGG